MQITPLTGKIHKRTDSSDASSCTYRPQTIAQQPSKDVVSLQLNGTQIAVSNHLKQLTAAYF